MKPKQSHNQSTKVKPKPPIKKKYIETPEALHSLFLDYINGLETINVPVSHVKLGTTDLKIKEPMTMQGFYTYCYDLGITIHHYIDNPDGAYDSYREIVTRIKDKIYSNNFSRAAVGLLKESIISKQLGLATAIDNKVSGSVNILNIDPIGG